MRKFAFWSALLAGWMLLSIASTGGGFTQSVLAQDSGVRALVINEFANVRIAPAIGAEVRGTVAAGFVFETVTGRSPDNEWIRVDFNGDEGWVNLTPLQIIAGNVGVLPVADPRSIPFGGFESPRAGLTSANSDFAVRAINGLRVRAGPSTAYPVLAELPINSVVPAFGRTLGNGWVQINQQGTLGWVAAGFLEIQGGRSIVELAINGIVADELPLSEATANDYNATLQLMLDRVNLAQPSLDSIRASWTDAAITGRASCQPFPAKPTNYNIPRPLLAAFFPTLDPLQTLFNDAMTNLRLAIDLFIQACQQPGTVNPVGQATVIGALEVVALVDSQFAELRRTITALLPEDRVVGEDECLFTFNNESIILPVISISQLVFDGFNPTRRATGYCFDATAGQTLLFETLQLDNSNVVHFLSVSPFDNPTNFIATGFGGTGENFLLQVGPLVIPETGRYLLVLSQNVETELPLNGEFALLITDLANAGGTTNFLIINPETGEITVVSPTGPGPGVTLPPPGVIVTVTPPPPGEPGLGGNAISPTTGQGQTAVCPGVSLTCEQLASCDEAYACLGIGNFALDPDEDGVPCEVIRCPSSP